MKFFFDLFPVILFFVAFKLYDIFVATAVAIAASILQILWVWWRHRQIEKMMWINLMIIIVFGGATLVLQDETFIKWKPTVLYWLFATGLLVSNVIFKKNLIQTMMEKQMALPIPVWNQLNISWIIFFVVMGLINLYVAFNFPIDTWVSFKLFGATGLMLVFIVGQILMLNKYLKDDSNTSLVNAQDVDETGKNILKKNEKE
ncbi:MAG TPA: septation protein A [Nitrosomonas sp.]|nr:septation protein A [Nitrosomonas sp.]HQU98872.1 septation protein A [Nitrosomonas sp.]HQX14368.1 septation protein A [Nitrosomonas sp.]HRB20315.1 septation protein A [Nitrosomonas sp.]HRB33655.1 septation protein A [Nitrosomonas sp.]